MPEPAPLNVGPLQRFCVLCFEETAHEDAMPEYPAWRCLTCGTLLDRRLEDDPK